MSLTSVIRHIEALDSTATDGSGKTGIVFGSFTAKYCIDGGALTSLTTETITTLGTFQAPSSAAHLRIKELNSGDPTKGIYEVHFHNSQLVAGSKLWLYLSANGAKVQRLEVDMSAEAISQALQSQANTNANTTIPGNVRDVSNATPAANSLGAGIAAIKVKTDNLPSDPADASDIAGAFTALRGADSDTLKTLSDQMDGIAADSPNTPTKNVAFNPFVFTMVDATDFNTPETAVTVTATISKDGGSFSSCSNAVAEMSGGFYKVVLTSTETNASVVALKFSGTGCAQRNFVFLTQPT